jgi:RNA polymerase sigma-70 factor (ECF subfamily)
LARGPSLGKPSALSDAEAVNRCQQGDRDAFRVLAERYGSVLFGTAFLMTRNHAIAEEMVQEGLVLAWRGIGGFRGGSLKAWMARILVNRVISEKRRGGAPTISLDDPDFREPASGEADDPAAATAVRLEQERIRGVLQQLPEEARQVVVLRFFSELSVAETAAALGVREGTVKSRLSRALDRLRELLRDQVGG